MLEDQVAFLLQKYLGNYVLGLNKEALKISVWRGDVELTNMQLRPEALNALKLPVKVKAGFLGSVRLKVPWSRLGQEPVLVYLDRILVLAEPATQVEGYSEDTIQEAKKNRVRELEMRLLERQQQLKSEMNTSWMGSLINTIIGNIKLSITNIHIRYEDIESNLGHPFAAGVTLSRLSAVTVDDSGRETFATGGALERIQKSVELDRLSLYFDSDIRPLSVGKPWEDLQPPEWNQIFELESKDGKLDILFKDHSYVLQPVTGNAKYTKIRLDESKNSRQALQQAAVNLDDVTLCLSKEGYRDILKLADNLTAFNRRLKYAHHRPPVSVKSDPTSWWKYACKVVTDEMKKASGRFSWEQVLRYARLRRRYVSLYASLLKSDVNRLVVEDNKEIEKMDRELDIEVILQWRMLAHKFVEQSADSGVYLNKQKPKQSWWSFGWSGSSNNGNEARGFSGEDWERLNKIIGYNEGSDDLLDPQDEGDLPHLFLEIHMKHNASKLITDGQEFLADLSCEGLVCSLKTYSEAMVFNLKLESYKLSSRHGLLAESATVTDSLVGTFSYKPFDTQVDWSFVAKASPCYMTYLKESFDEIVTFFKSNTTISQTLALETAAAVQMTIDGVKRTAQEQVTRALKDKSRFLLDLDIAAPKITIPTKFCPDDSHATRLLLDLGNLMLCTQDDWDSDSSEEQDMYLQFNFVLSDVSAFLVDGDYHWNRTPHGKAATEVNYCNFFPVIEKCGIVLKLQQIQSENPLYPSTRIAVRLPSLGFHFSPARYHRLLQVAKIFQDEDSTSSEAILPWSQADFEGWLFLLTWKGVGNREAIWQRRYVCLVGPFLYILEYPSSKTYKNYVSLRGKQLHQVPTEFTGGVSNMLALYDAGQSSSKVLEDANALILRCGSDESRKIWQNRIQGAIYRASGSSSITTLSEVSSPSKPVDSSAMSDFWNMEKLFVCGVLDELRICFSCSYQSNQSFKKVLLCSENRLFEFRAVGGQVELSIKASNILIGTVLKSLEIEDQFFCVGATRPRYLARSFINNTEKATLTESSSISDPGQQNSSNRRLYPTDSEDKFFEASDDLDDLSDYSVSRIGSMSEYFTAQPSFTSMKSSMKPPTFSRIPGLIPDAELQAKSSDLETTDTLDSFVKAQIVIYDQDSPHYSSLDNRVMIILATLSFFCHRPTILAILEFVNDINITEEKSDSDAYINEPSASVIDASTGNSDNWLDLSAQEPVVKGLLSRGKTRVIFHLTLNMARAQIFLMDENGSSLATLSQNNLLTDIKVFPSSFNIKAALGNLKISDDSLPSSHSYFWVCDMRNPGGSSFVELDFSSFSADDEDYCGFEYSLIGKLSEVRIVYLNRFVQEIVSYFMGLVPSNSESVVKLKDQVTNAEKWVSTSEIEGLPALKLDLSLSRPIILMPRRTDSSDYLELDVLHITVQNTFHWLGGRKDEMNAVHLEIMTIKVKDVCLIVGCGTVSGESIIQDVVGLSVVIQRSLRDILHQIPVTEAAIKIEVLKAALSNREYEIITECALSNFSETPRIVPPLDKGSEIPSEDIVEHPTSLASTTMKSEIDNKEIWITMKTSVAISLVELSLHAGSSRDSPLANVQASGAWMLYKSNTCGEGFLFATLRGFSVIDAREGTKEELRLAIGKSGTIGYRSLDGDNDVQHMIDTQEGEVSEEPGHQPVPSMLILDAIFRNALTSVSLCIQRPKLLVALDFLLAVAEFFVPSVRSMLSSGEDKDPLLVGGAIIVDQPIYVQPTSIVSLSPRKPLIVDDERFDHFLYDGNGGQLYLQDTDGRTLSDPATEPIIYVGSGKKLQFKNVTVVNGEYLDSCIFLGAGSSYSVFEDDNVFLKRGERDAHLDSQEDRPEGLDGAKAVATGSVEFIIELQAIGPELTFYNTSEDVGELSMLSTKVIHAHLDVFCRLVMKGDSFEINGNILGLKVESNGMRVLEPFDICVKFSNASGKTNIHLAVSDIFMNFSFSILRLFLAVEEDILAFLRMTSKKVTVVCSQFDKVGIIQNYQRDQTYAVWRPRTPSGYAFLGDCLTPLNEPPSKGVLAVNTSIARVKRPVSYKLIWSCNSQSDRNNRGVISTVTNNENSVQYSCYSIWFPVAPKGYVAVGCVVSADCAEPPLSSALCILASLVSPCGMKDCIVLNLTENHSLNIAFWRVENSFGSFLPTDPVDMSPTARAYDLRRMTFGYSEHPIKLSKRAAVQDNFQHSDHTVQLERSALLTSGRMFEAVASFRLIWWNQGTASRKKLSIWRPVLQQGMVFLGDLAVQGYEPPNSAIVLNDTGDEACLRLPQDFQLVGKIRKQKGNESISFWLPQAPPGFVALGCIASKSSPKQEDFSSLRCIRSDMVTGDQFSEESIWDSSDTKVSTEPFSLWSVGNEMGTFIIRNGFKKPPKRFALKIAGPTVSRGSDDTVIDAEIKTFSAAVFDDYGGLMVPLFNISLSSIAFSLHGRPDYLNSTVSFSLAGRSYNDKYDAWEPLVEPTDGFLRYQYDLNAPGAATQLRMTTTKELNLNVSVSNANMMFQAYSSWNNLNHNDESYKEKEVIRQTSSERSIIDVHHRKNYYIIPQNKLGQDIYIRAAESKRFSNIIKMPSGDNKPVKVPVAKNMLDSHLKGKLGRISRCMVTIIIADAEFPTREGLTTEQYTVAVRLFTSHPIDSPLQQQSARTSGAISQSLPSGISLIKWGEAIFFKVDSVDHYMVEFIVIDVGRGEPIGIYSAPLKQIAYELSRNLEFHDSNYDLSWRELSSAKTTDCHSDKRLEGRIRCAVLLSARPEIKDEKDHMTRRRNGFLQISPTRQGPWTTVRLNYAARAACWRLGNDVVASEVTVKDGNRYVSIRSLVSVTNKTDFVIDLRLKSKSSSGNLKMDEKNEDEVEGQDDSRLYTEEFIEIERYSPSNGWVSSSSVMPLSNSNKSEKNHQGLPSATLPDGWEWTDDWHVDTTSVREADGWVYAPDTEHLKWPASSDHISTANYARERRWIRNRKYSSYDSENEISIGLLEPGHTIPLPLSGLAHPVMSYILQLRPRTATDPNEYSWSSMVEKQSQSEVYGRAEKFSEICVSTLTESDELLYCSQQNGSSLNNYQGLWFCLSIQAKQIGKDVHSDPIHDWNLIVDSPLSVTNFLPLSTEYAVIDKQLSGESKTSSEGTLVPGGIVKVYNADLRDPLYLSLLPPGGWEQIHEPVPISHPSRMPSKMICLRNSFSGRIIQIILEQNYDKERLVSRAVRIHVPYWIASARCPPLKYNLMDMSGRKEKKHFSVPFRSTMKTEKIFFQITHEEMVEGYTIASALNFKLLGISASIARPGKELFGPVKDLSALGDMDGSVDLYAYDADGNCMRIFVSSKPSPYQATPTKVITIRPFMTFTNRLGQEVFIRFNIEDQEKTLRASHSRVSFIYHEAGPDRLQVRLEDTDWCFPVKIEKEDTITMVLRKHLGGRKFIRAEIRGYDEGSRFSILFRLEPEHGPIRIENRTMSTTIKIRQSGLDDDSWITLKPLFTTKFSWDNPYGEKHLDICISGGTPRYVQNINLEKLMDSMRELKANGLKLRVMESGDAKIARFLDGNKTLSACSDEMPEPTKTDRSSSSSLRNEMESSTAPLELILELGIVGVSLIDHRPRELLYLYLEKLFVSYSTGYDAGTTSRFKLIVGQLQLDNQLPLTVMPVVLAPEDMPDINHPVFKATITMCNNNADGTQVYPYIYVRVTDKCWRINVHEPIIWALVDFYNNLRLDSIPSSSGATQADPEIRLDLIDVSEVRLKLSLETAPAQRPQGALGIWSPVLSAVGNAFKIQLHLRKVMQESRFIRRSSIIPAIVNRIKRDLIHNPLHLIFSVDVLSMTKSTLASLSKGFAELSTDGQFLQLRTKQMWSRRITGVGDGILQGTEALAQGVAFGVSGVLKKPVESAREYGVLGLAHGLGQAFLGFFVQPLSGALDFVSLTVDGISASCARCFEILSNKAIAQRVRNPRAFHANGVLREYCEREAVGQMVLVLAEASRHLGCTDLFKEPSKYAWSDCYEDHFIVAYHRIVLVTNKRVMLLQCLAPEKMDKRPSKIIWDVPWEELLALELAKAGYRKPSHLIIHLKNFKRSESFVRLVKCTVEEEEEQEPQAVMLCSSIRKMWKSHQSDMNVLTLKVPSSQRHVQFAWDEADGRDSHNRIKPMIKPSGFTAVSSHSDDRRFIKHTVNFRKIWSSERDYRSRCTFLPKQVLDDATVCSIWRPLCPDGYVSVGDIAHVGIHPPHVAAIYRNSNLYFALPIGYDLVWRNCASDYIAPLSIWLPRPPDGFVAVGCVALAAYEEPPLDSAYCVNAGVAEETLFEEQMMWTAPDSYPWACYIYQVQSEALQFIALRQPKEESDWRPMRVSGNVPTQMTEFSVEENRDQ